MACKLSDDVSEVVNKEIDEWLTCNSDGNLVLLEVCGEAADSCTVNLLLGSEYEIKLHVPSGYPDFEGNFLIEAESVIQTWAIAINEFLTDSGKKLTVADVLNRAVQLFSDRHKQKADSSEEEMDADSDDEDDEEEEVLDDTLDIDDDDTFNTAWELKVARKKARWSKKEPLIREMMKKKRCKQGTENKQSQQQIFTSNAALGILTNDLIKIMKSEETCGFSAEPIDDNIYHWKVKLQQFQTGSELAADLAEIMKRHGYNYIEMEMMFEIDLFPFYPPLVKVLRPRLQGCMMQRITNIEFLQLSYWSPTKDMLSVIEGIRDFLQQWARIDIDHERNDLSRCPYLDIEHHLLTLAQVSEMTPRANDKYTLTQDKIEELKTTAKVLSNKACAEGSKEEYWARGVGYGHGNRPQWDMDAYLAAKAEKDNKIKSVLREILSELKKLPLYAGSPCLSSASGDSEVAGTSSMDISADSGLGVSAGDFSNDIYTVIEGSVLVPFLEQHLKENSLLEISRHATVYSVIISVIREIAYRKELLPLLCWLEGQTLSLYQFLEQINDKATLMLKQISKPANGHLLESAIDDSDSDSEGEDGYSDEFVNVIKCHVPQRRKVFTPPADTGAEEKLPREIGELFKLVKCCLERENLIGQCFCPSANGDAAAGGDVSRHTNPHKFYSEQEVQYRDKLKKYQFQSCDFAVSGRHSHHYSKQFSSQPTSKTQVIRIVQELSSLSTSLPLDLSSSIFVRTDDNKISLMQALITGPEGTPYSNGCFLFDIFFPNMYPMIPPKVNLRTTGNGSVRFNPNLYNCGKVCLSLLGTWQGHGGEEWNDKTSTILQILVSIQSLILVPDPYFNEPGYEQSMNTDEGKKASADYNKNVQINCINHAMIGQLQHPPPGFQTAIRAHFYLKRDMILQEVQQWLKKDKCSQLESAVHQLKKELKKLSPPTS